MKTWKQDAHTIPLAVWTGVCVLAALVLLDHAPEAASRPLKAGEVAAGIGLLMVAPAAFAAYLWRARHVWVQIDVDRGLVVSGKGLIPWASIRRVRRRRPSLRSKSGPVELPKFGGPEGISWLDLSGCVAVEGGLLGFAVIILVVALTAAWVIFFVFLPLLVVPLLEVFAPFGERFTVDTTTGRPLVLRDLRDADAFAAELSSRVRVEG